MPPNDPSLAQPVLDKAAKYKYDHILDNILELETGRDTPEEKRIKAIGDNGKAVGPYQQHAVFVAEVNRLNKLRGIDSNYTWEDSKDMVKSRQIAKDWIDIVVPKLKERLGKEPSDYQIAQAYNLGTIKLDIAGIPNKTDKDLIINEGNSRYGSRYNEVATRKAKEETAKRMEEAKKLSAPMATPSLKPKTLAPPAPEPGFFDSLNPFSP